MVSALLDVRRLEVSASSQSGPLTLLHGVNLRLLPGHVIGIVGESGSGKTTLTRSVAGFLDRNCRVVSGEVAFDDRVVASADLQPKPAGASHLGLVLQSPMASLNPVLKIGTQMAEVLRANKVQQRKSRMRATLTSVGFADPDPVLGSYPHQLSGGMAQRAAIALAMLCEPRVLIGDECTTALDASLQARVVAHFRRIADEESAGVLMVTHDLALASEVCDELIIMHAGEVVESGPLASVLRTPRHRYTASLIDAVPSSTQKRPILTPPDGRSDYYREDCADPGWCASHPPTSSHPYWTVEPDGHGHRCVYADRAESSRDQTKGHHVLP